MTWTIQEVARLAGTTPRALRHYEESGLLQPDRNPINGYREYDETQLRRLQHILLLRELGLSLTDVARALADRTQESVALAFHLELLEQRREDLERQIQSVKHTLAALSGKERFVAEKAFEGFDNSQYEQEVRDRWGEQAWSSSAKWWDSKSKEEQVAWTEQVAQMGRDWRAASEDPEISPTSPAAQELARRHVEWLRSIPGTPGPQGGEVLAEYARNLAEMYVADERFAANYGGVEGAKFVRAALLAYLGD